MKPLIKHLVIAGGAHVGFSYYGAMKTLFKSNFVNINNIETIHATSVGTLLSVFLTLDIEWDVLDNHILRNNWQTTFPLNFATALQAVPKCGFFDIRAIETIIDPMFKYKNLSLDTTLLEYYEFTKKDLHFISTQYEPFQLKDISHKTHPEWRVIDAVYASSCFPVLFVPYEKSSKLYLDGAIYANYPINYCVKMYPKEEIFGISFQHRQTKYSVYEQSRCRLFLFLLDLIFKIWHEVKEPTSEESNTIPYQIKLYGDTRITQAFDTLKSEDERRRMCNIGITEANTFLTKNDFL
jgi:predicted acylesterase/phospholipase RssA